jgi:hypothetical protein
MLEQSGGLCGHGGPGVGASWTKQRSWVHMEGHLPPQWVRRVKEGRKAGMRKRGEKVAVPRASEQMSPRKKRPRERGATFQPAGQKEHGDSGQGLTTGQVYLGPGNTEEVSLEATAWRPHQDPPAPGGYHRPITKLLPGVSEAHNQEDAW